MSNKWWIMPAAIVLLGILAVHNLYTSLTNKDQLIAIQQQDIADQKAMIEIIKLAHKEDKTPEDYAKLEELLK